MSGLRLYLLGPPQIELDNTPVTIRRSKVLALLIYLAVSGEPQRRDVLATLLWPNSSQSQARSALRHELSILNKTLGGNWLEIERETIGLSPNIWLDVHRFQQHVAEFDPDAPDTLAALVKAVDLYRDDFLAGFTLSDCPDFDEWQFFQAEGLRQSLVTTLDTLVTVFDNQHDYETAIPHARQWLALDPLHEPAHQTLMRLYALSGRQAAALRQFSECQRLLQDELGIAPDAETRALAAAIQERRLKPAAEGTIARLDRPGLAAGDDEPLGQAQAVEVRPLFVGREAQLAQLASALEQALRGQGQLRLITGEAGAGKSALVTEFIHRAVSTQADLLISVGSCDSQTGPLDPYLPFREALTSLVLGSKGVSPLNLRSNISPPNPPGGGTSPPPGGSGGPKWTDMPLKAQPPQRIRQIASRALLDHGPQLLPLFVPAAELPGVINTARQAGWQGEAPSAIGEGQALDQSRIFEQGAAVLQAIAAQIPLVLVLEDLHWADSGSLGLLFRLVRQLGGSRLLVIGSYRSEAVSRGQQGQAHPLEQWLLEVQRNWGGITLDLEAARLAEGRQVVDGILDAEPNRLDESFRQAFHRQTGGHPLFVVELLEDLKKEGTLVQDEAGQWVIGAELDWLSLPTRVEGAIAGRMAHLSEEQRWLLTIASVMGERFLAEVVAHVAGADPRELTRTLSRILQAQHRLVEAEGVERLGQHRLTRYRFRHNLMQTYLYEGLDEVQRIYLHEDVAHALEALYGKEAKQIALPLARHYEAAGVAPKAVDYLILAGEQAVRQAANEEAIHHFTRALSLLLELPESLARDQQEFALQFNLGRVLATSKGFAAPEVGEAYARALALGRQLEETQQIIQVLHGLTQHALFRSELALAQTYGQECLRLATESQDPERLLEAYQSLRRIAHRNGQHAEAVTYGEQVIAFYRAHRPSLTFDDAYALAFTLAAMGLNLVPLGYPDRALGQAQEGLILAQSHAHHFGTAYCLNFMAYIHLLRGDWREALQFAEAAIDVSNSYSFAQLRTLGQYMQGAALTRLGEAEVGIRLVRQAVAEREAMGVTFGNQTALARLAEACGSAGRVTEGLVLINDALADLDISNERQYEPKLHQIKGDLLLLQDLTGDELFTAQQEAEICFRRAIEIAQDQGAKLWEARALASLCRLLASQGRDEGCCQQLADLYAWFTEGFETEDLQVVRAVLQEAA